MSGLRLKPTLNRATRHRSAPVDQGVENFYLLDRFNAPDGTSLQGHLPDFTPSGNVWDIEFGTITIQGNQAVTDHTVTGLGSADYEMGLSNGLGKVTVIFPASGTNRNADLAVRYFNGQNTWFFRLHLEQGYWAAIRVVGNVFTTVRQQFIALQPGVPYEIEVEAVADTFTARVNGLEGAEVFTITDSTLIEQTRWAISGRNSVGAPGIIFDNFGFEPRSVTTSALIVEATPSLVGAFDTGLTHVHNPSTWRTTAWDTAKVSLGQAVGVQNVQLFPFGLQDPWPLADPNAWIPGSEPVPATPGALDDGTQTCLAAALAAMAEVDPTDVFMMTLYGAPWWMKGLLQTDGTTIPCNYADHVYSDQGRVMTQYLPHWQLLVKEATKLALAAGVRWFLIWNEFKGFWRTRLNEAQKWEADYYSGTPGLNADVGFTYFYKVTVDGILEAAAELVIAESEILCGGPYPVIRSQGKRDADSVTSAYPMLYDRVWGTMNKMPIHATELFHDLVAANSLKYDFFTIDFGANNKDGVDVAASEWELRTKYTDLMDWVDVEKVRAGLPADFPVVGAEAYVTLGLETSDLDTAPAGLITAVKAESYRRLLLGGLYAALAWGPGKLAPDGFVNEDGWMISDPTVAGGGDLLAWGQVNQWFHEHFGPGTSIYEFTIHGDDTVSGIASDTKIMLINQNNASHTVYVAGVAVTMNAYEVKLIDR